LDAVGVIMGRGKRKGDDNSGSPVEEGGRRSREKIYMSLQMMMKKRVWVVTWWLHYSCDLFY